MAVDNINIVDIAPGWVMVDRYDGYTDEYKQHINNTIPIGKMAQSREVGSLILTLAEESGKTITGTTIFMDGGLYLTCNNFDRKAAQERLESATERQDR
jgi:NAD(P)-dependent dehydrogenase (short-subunit alcohol dehydrogenase family)